MGDIDNPSQRGVEEKQKPDHGFSGKTLVFPQGQKRKEEF
jgi:hypothetical protein